MPIRYFAIPVPTSITSSVSNVVALHYVGLDYGLGALSADFLTDDEDHLLRVSFAETHIFRALDEMPLSTEGDEGWDGHVPDHLAYRVQGAMFWLSQSEAFRTVYSAAEHYRFITGWTCLDVVAGDEPRFEIVRKGAQLPDTPDDG